MAKITIEGKFNTGESYVYTANNKAEFNYCMAKIFDNETCNRPDKITIEGRTPKYVMEYVNDIFDNSIDDGYIDIINI